MLVGLPILFESLVFRLYLMVIRKIEKIVINQVHIILIVEYCFILILENKLQFILVKGGNHGMATSKAAFFANVMAQDQEVSSEVKVDQLPSTLADLLAQKYHILRIV